MADEKELKQMNKNAILVHHLRLKDRNAALFYFPEKFIEKVSYSSEGLQIFFKDYELARKSILRRKIEVKGIFYNIYPMVTNLTVCGIGRYATNSTIENIMQEYGFIIDSYGIQETTERHGYKTVSLTNDYRIILDIPEVLAPNLKPVTLPNTTHKAFEVLFFCRLCRINGHMQFQCPKFMKSSPASFEGSQIMDFSRKMSYESDSSDLRVKNNEMNRPQAGFPVDERNPKIHPHSQTKSEKGHRNFADQNYCKNKSYNLSCHENIEDSKRSSYENVSSDLIVNNNEINSSRSHIVCADRRNSKMHPASLVKPKKQNYSSDQNSCSKNKSRNLSCHQSIDVSKRISHESDSEDSMLKNNKINRGSSNFCNNRQNSKIYLDTQMKSGNEQNYFSNQNNSSKKKCHNMPCNQNKNFSRRISYENNSLNLTVNMKRIKRTQSDSCTDQQNSKIHPDSLLKPEERQNYSSDQNSSSKNKSRNSSYHLSVDVSKRRCYENDSAGLMLNKSKINRPHSDFCVNQLNSKVCLDSQIESGKERNYSSDQNNCSKKKCHNNSYHQNKYVSRRISHGNDSLDLSVKNKSIKQAQSNIYVDRRNIKNRDDIQVKTEEEQNYFSDSQMEPEKEQNCFPNQNNCSKNKNRIFTCHQNKGVCRRISHQDVCSDLTVNHKKLKRSKSDIFVDRQNPKNRDNFQVKTQKEQNYFSDKNSCSNKKSHKIDISNNCITKSNHSNSKNSSSVLETADSIQKKHQQEKLSSIPDDDGENLRDKNSSALKAPSSEILKKRKRLKKKYFHGHFDNEADIERGQPSTSSGCNNQRTPVSSCQRKMKAFMGLLSNLLPPNMDLLETKKLFQVVAKCQPKDIPEEVKTALLDILTYNEGLKKKDVNEEERRFLNWISTVLSKIEQEKCESEKTDINHVQYPIKENEEIKGGKSDAPKQQSPKKRKITLSMGIREAISKTDGEIPPKLLCNFLNHVRGRRKWFEVASVFTENIPGLASQLLEVKNTYYKYVQKRGSEEDRDINYINRLRKKMLRHSKITTQTCSDDKEDFIEVKFKAESDMPETTVKIEPGTTRMAVKTELDTEEMAGTAELDMVELVKSEADVTEMLIKKEAETFMRQSSSYGNSFNENLSSNPLYGASYFTNITQMPFSFTSIKTEVSDTE